MGTPAGRPERPARAAQLGLEAHPEGGWYRRLWAASEEVVTGRGRRAAATAIHYLLAPGECSRWHRVTADELWLWQGGGPLVLVQAATPGRTGGADTGQRTDVLGPDAGLGQRLWAVVPGGHWQTARPGGAEAALVACVVAPGFDWQDFTLHDG